MQGTGECQKKKGRIKGRGKDGRKEVEEKESRVEEKGRRDRNCKVGEGQGEEEEAGRRRFMG